MKIIYYCYGGSHSSVTAAAIHLGYLMPDQKPTPDALMRVPLFDRQTDKDYGKFVLLGQDEMGNEVYACGCRSLGSKIEKTLQGVAKITDTPVDDVVFVDTLKGVNNLMRVGGFLSRKLRLVAIGRPIVIKGTLDAFNGFVKIVEDVKENLKNRL